MRLFSKRPRVDADALCESLYDRGPFRQGAPGHDEWADEARGVLGRLRACDPGFDGVDGAEFASELRALWLEVVALAWSHVFGDAPALDQGDFTRGFLVGHGHGDLWDRMGPYDQVAADAATVGLDPHRRRDRDLVTDISQARARLFERATAEGHDPVAAARVANRIATRDAWASGRLPVRLAVEMTQRLGVGGEANWSPLSAVAERFYDEAAGALRRVRLAA